MIHIIILIREMFFAVLEKIEEVEKPNKL